MKRFLIEMILIFFLFLLNPVSGEDYPTREIEVTPLLNLNTLEPKVNVIQLTIISRSFFSVDSKENLYFLDTSNHRILKFNKDGKFISQIGSIGQSEKDLYNPVGIFVTNNTLYILDDAGKKIKLFSLNGNYLSSFAIENAHLSGSLYVCNDLILVNVKYRNKESYNQEKLIAIFNKKGKRIKNVGKIIKCNKIAGYLTFNSIFINVVDNIIFGGFSYYPVIFAFDFEGRELFYKNLTDLVKEIQELIEYGKKMGFDTPESMKEEWGVRAVIYCSGFGVDKNKHIYYALNVSHQKKYLVLHFDEKGALLEKIIFKNGKRVIQVIHLYVDEQGNRWGIGFIEKDGFFLFKF